MKYDMLRIQRLLDQAEFLESIHCPRSAAARRRDADKIIHKFNQREQYHEKLLST